MTRILVTGGAGAIGSHLVARLLADGHEVVVLDDLSSGRAELVPPAAKLVRGSVAVAADVERAFAHEPALVAHLAALFANQNSVEHPVADLHVNGLGTLHVLERARALGVRKVLYCSSSCVYSPQVAHEDERDAPLRGETPYAITKILGEQYGRFFVDHHGMDVVIVRPFNVYGPHEWPGPYRNVIPNFLDRARQGLPLPITGTGEETRDFTYVSDAVDGIVRALLRRTEPGAVYNIASGRETSVRDLAERINALTGNAAGIELRPRRSWDATPRRCGRIERAQRDLGYAPTVDLDEGLRQTWEWLTANA